MRQDNGCYTAELLEQLRPQQLDTNLFFGPLNALTQREFLEQHNIRFFIGVGIDTSRLASLVQDGQLLGCSGPFPPLMVNFDQKFDYASLAAASESTQLYHLQNSELLAQLVSQTAHAAQRNIAYYTYSNVFSDGLVDRFETFNDLVQIFKMAAHMGNILVFSQNGNDEQLLMLLIFFVLQKYPCVGPAEAVKFIKCLRPSVHDLTPEQLYWCLKAKEHLGAAQVKIPAEQPRPTRKCSDGGDPQGTNIRFFNSTKRSRLNQ